MSSRCAYVVLCHMYADVLFAGMGLAYMHADVLYSGTCVC